MRCDFDSRRCIGQSTVHLRRITRTTPHPQSTSDRPCLIVVASDPAGNYCEKHAQELLDNCGDLFVGDDVQ